MGVTCANLSRKYFSIDGIVLDSDGLPGRSANFVPRVIFTVVHSRKWDLLVENWNNLKENT